MLNRVILGDNQFFGINHMSEEKAQALAERFRDITTITNVIDIAYNCGIRGLMLNSNERAKDICDYLRKNSSRYTDLSLYPSIPYPHKYANLVTEKGILTALKDIVISDNTFGGTIGLLAKGGFSIFEKDMIKLMQILIDIEMKLYRDLNIKVIFLQNIVTDLLLGFGLQDVFINYSEYIKDKYGVEPGFITMNMPKLVDFLLDCNIENPIVCFSFNKAGYFMNPDIESYTNTICEKKFRPMVMSIFASGIVKPKEAIEFICEYTNIKSIVFGASSKQHIEETNKLIEQNMPKVSESMFS